MKRILIIRSGAVGDLILTLPVLSALKKRYNGLSIDMMGNPARLDLLKQWGYVDNVLSIDSRDMTPLFVENAPLDGPSLQNLRSYDATISYLPDADGIFTKNLRGIAAGPVLTGQSHPVIDHTEHTGHADRRIHMTHVLMKALTPLDVDPVAEIPTLQTPAYEAMKHAHPQVTDRPLIAVHPGSGGAEKCWPVERYADLIDALDDRGYEPVVTFGPADDVVRTRIVPRIKSHNVRIAENLSLVDLAVLFSRCQGMVGNDSGITHLAAAAGTPVIALFGPTDPAVWGPRGKRVSILWGAESIVGDVGETTWTEAFYTRNLTDITLASVMNELTDLESPA